MGLAISSFEAEKITQEQTSTLPPSLPLVIMWAFFRVKKKKNTTACIKWKKMTKSIYKGLD
jgi:hypothetical protein